MSECVGGRALANDPAVGSASTAYQPFALLYCANYVIHLSSEYCLMLNSKIEKDLTAPTTWRALATP
jgi:hypothetical protein